MLRRRDFLAAIAAAFVTVLPVLTPPAAAAEKPIVFAAASLKTALDAVASAWKAETGKEVTISYAASGPLARQIEEGAPADIFFTADTKWADDLAGKGLLVKETQTDLLGNELVLIAPSDSPASIDLTKGADIAALLGADGRLAIGEPKSVPAGRYGQAALEALGAWDGLKDRTALVDKVTAALTLVARGEAPLGIVYKTDAQSEPKVKVVATFPADSHPPIVYPVAKTTSSTNPDADAFLAYLKSDKAAAVFEKLGFKVL